MIGGTYPIHHKLVCVKISKHKAMLFHFSQRVISVQMVNTHDPRLNRISHSFQNAFDIANSPLKVVIVLFDAIPYQIWIVRVRMVIVDVKIEIELRALTGGGAVVGGNLIRVFCETASQRFFSITLVDIHILCCNCIVQVRRDIQKLEISTDGRDDIFAILTKFSKQRIVLFCDAIVRLQVIDNMLMVPDAKKEIHRGNLTLWHSWNSKLPHNNTHR